MISFACKQCGKQHERPDADAGSLVFCECGHGNRVPWEISPAEPEPVAVVPVETSAPVDVLEAVPLEAERPGRSSRRQDAVPRDPNFCFNHPETQRESTCADCGEAFCGDCVVSLQGQTLCGPCKNFRTRGWQRPARVSAWAVVAFASALLIGPVGFCLVSVGASREAPGFGYAGVLPALVVMALAVQALREIETNPRISGRALAITALVLALVSGILSVLFSILIQRGMA
jgi:hypothetical protein